MSAIIARLPEGLRRVLDAELAAGNRIAEAGCSSPAPPVGAWVRMGAAFRAPTDAPPEGVSYYRRNSSLWCGEYTDAKRWYFLLDPAVPGEEPPSPAEFHRLQELARVRAEQERQAAAEADLKAAQGKALRRARALMRRGKAVDAQGLHAFDRHVEGYDVELDWRGESAYYKEPGRQVWLFCAWHGGPVGHVQHQNGQWQYDDGRHVPLSAEERVLVLHRVVRYVRAHDGFAMVPVGI